MIRKITNGKIITDTLNEGKNLYFDDKVIIDITEKDLPADEVIDAKGNYVSAGFIDIHTHGGGGSEFMDGSKEAVIDACRIHLTHGTTSIYPTTLASSPDILFEALHDIKEAMENEPDDVPHIMGAHLEGPYFSLNQSGAQNPKYITPPIKEDYEKALQIGKGVIKRWSFAPELSHTDEFMDFLNEHGIVASIAHSDATYKDVKRVYDKGLRLATHLYSGMSTITRVGGFRVLGAIESCLLLDDMMVETIADGCHLPPELLRLIYKTKGADNICLVTDSMRAAGQNVKETVIGSRGQGMACIVEDGVAKLPDRTAFAGSVATADRLIRTFYKDAGVDIVNTVKMMTVNPAKIMKLASKGKLEKGYDADIVIFDDNINIKNVFKSKNKVLL